MLYSVSLENQFESQVVEATLVATRKYRLVAALEVTLESQVVEVTQDVKREATQEATGEATLEANQESIAGAALKE